jgi:hypothetical protein
MRETETTEERKKRQPNAIKSGTTPLMVAAKDVERIILGYSAKKSANDRSLKRGPRFFLNHGRPFYRVSDLIEYFTKNPVETTDDN